MTAQLELRPDWSARWDDNRRLLRQMAEAIGLKQCAIDLDVSLSGLSQGLDERDRNLPAKWVDYLVAHAPAQLGDEYVRRLAKLRGLEVGEAPVITPAEELSALQAALREELGSVVRGAIVTRAAAIARDRKWSTR